MALWITSPVALGKMTKALGIHLWIWDKVIHLVRNRGIFKFGKLV